MRDLQARVEYDYRIEAMKAHAWHPSPDAAILVLPKVGTLTRQVLPARRYRLELVALAAGLFSIGYTLVSMLSY